MKEFLIKRKEKEKKEHQKSTKNIQKEYPKTCTRLIQSWDGRRKWEEVITEDENAIFLTSHIFLCPDQGNLHFIPILAFTHHAFTSFSRNSNRLPLIHIHSYFISLFFVINTFNILCNNSEGEFFSLLFDLRIERREKERVLKWGGERKRERIFPKICF